MIFFAENAFLVVKDAEFRKLENPEVGTVFEINDHRGVIVGIAEVATTVWRANPVHNVTARDPVSADGALHHFLHPGGAQVTGGTARIQRAVSRIGPPGADPR